MLLSHFWFSAYNLYDRVRCTYFLYIACRIRVHETETKRIEYVVQPIYVKTLFERLIQ